MTLPVRREPRHFLVEGGLKPDDLVIDGISRGFRMSALDVTIKDMLRLSGHVANVGHNTKLAKYQDNVTR